jgi:carbon monoxide dehydrogenase subunit G
MPSARFSRTLDVASPPARCWSVLTDVVKVGGWVTVVGEVREIERLKRYQAVLRDQLGPFKLLADVDVDVTDLEEERSIHFKGSGSDRQVGTTINVFARMQLEPTASGTTITIDGNYSVLGSVATMGSSTIRKKADSILEEFFAAASQELS